MKTKTFDAVAASRQWREAAGRRLDAMSMGERLTFLEGLKDRGAAKTVAGESSVVSEDAAPYGRKPGDEIAP